MSSTEYGVVSDIARGADWLDDGNGNWTQLRRSAGPQWGIKMSTTTALTYGYFGGQAWTGSAWSTVSDGTVSLTDNTTNFVERTQAGVVSVASSNFTASKIPMAIVTTSGGIITAFADARRNEVPSAASYTDENAQDAVGAMVDSTLVYTDATPLLSRAALTGDVTASAGSNATTIPNDTVTYAKMQNVSAASTLLGRGDSGSGDPQEITLGSGLSMSGTTLSSSGGSLSDGDKGDITVSGSGATWTIDNDVVTFAKMQNIATSKLLGRSTASSGDIEELTIGTGLTLSSGTLSASNSASAIAILIQTAFGWWEASKQKVISDNTAITLFADVSPYGRYARQSGGARPTYQTNEINSTLPCIRFDGTDDSMPILGVMSCNNGFSAIVVAKQNSQAQFGSIFCGSAAGSLDLQFKQTSGKLAIVSANTVENLAQTTTPSAGYHLWEAYFDGDSGHEIVMDGTSDGTATTTTTYSDVTVIGRNGNANNQFLNADVVLLAFFQRNLVSADRTTIRDYVETTYGLTIA